MIINYKSENVWWYDLAGYGQEGKIEGIQRDEFMDLILEVSQELEDNELKYTISTLQDELVKRENRKVCEKCKHK